MRNKNVCLTQLWGVSIITPDLLTLCLVFEITFHMSKLELKFTLCRNFIIIWQLRYYIPKLTKFWYHKSFLCPKIECPQSNCQRVWRVRGGSELKFTLCRNFIIIWQLRHYSKTHKILIPSIIFVFENRVSPIQLSVSMEGGGRFRATLKHSPVKNLFLQIICSL